MYCHNCGKSIPDGSRFCHYCGAPQAAAGGAPQPEQPVQQRPAQAERPQYAQAERQQYAQAPQQRPVQVERPQYTHQAQPRPAQQRPVQQRPAQAERPQHAQAPQPRPVQSRPAGGSGENMLAELRGESVRQSLLPLLVGVVIAGFAFYGGGPMVGLVIGGLSILIGGWPMINTLRGLYQREVREFMDETGCGGEAEQFYFHTNPLNGLYLGDEFVYFRSNRRDVLLRPWDVAWVYQHVTTHYALFIPLFKSRSVILRTMGGKSYEFALPKKDIQPTLEAIQSALPGVVTGYNANLENAYLHNRQAFATRWEQAVPGCMEGHKSR